jgi:hypothetical protein
VTGSRQLLAVLARYQAAAALLAGGEQAAFMRSAVYLLVPCVWAAALLWCARAIRTTPRRGPLRLLSAAQVVSLASAALSALVGLLPRFDWTPSVMNLVTFLVLPAAVLVLVRRARSEVDPLDLPSAAGVRPLASAPAPTDATAGPTPGLAMRR